MKIHILYPIKDGPFGGGNQFLKALKQEFQRKGAYSESPYTADAVLYNSFFFGEGLAYFDLLYELSGKKNKPVFLHRLDGAIQEIRGDAGQAFYDELVARWSALASDGVVFQNKFCGSSQRKHGFPAQCLPHAHIMNAPEPELFYPAQPEPLGEKLRLVYTSWSSNLRKGFPTLEFLDETLDFSRYEFTFVGNAPAGFTTKNIKLTSPMDSRALAGFLRTQHVFLGLSHGEPCSNAIMEAMHCGLPALIRNDGGNSEFAPFGAVLYDKDEDIAALLQKIREDYAAYRQALCPPSIDKIAEAYLAFAASLLNGKIRKKISPFAYAKFRKELVQRSLLPKRGLWSILRMRAQ